MLVLRSPDDASRIADPDIRKLVQLRFAQVSAGEPYDPERHGYMIVALVVAQRSPATYLVPYLRA